MSEMNRQLAIRWMDEVWNQRKEGVIDELLHPDAVGHAEGAEDARGPAGFRAHRDLFLGAFPDLRMQVEGTIAEGDRVAVRWRVRATHAGAHLGFRATQAPVELWGITWLTFVDGRITEGWDAWNSDGVVQRLRVQAETP